MPSQIIILIAVVAVMFSITSDIHCLMIGVEGVGKTAFYTLTLSTPVPPIWAGSAPTPKGDQFRNYAGIAKERYGYRIFVLDLRNPTRSYGNNILQLVNRYMDTFKKNSDSLALKAKAEKYAKITAKTILTSIGEESASYGQNAFFYDAVGRGRFYRPEPLYKVL